MINSEVCLKSVLFFTVFMVFFFICHAQFAPTNASKLTGDLHTPTDSNIVQGDTLADSVSVNKMPNSSGAISSVVDYFAEDSVTFDVKNQKAYLHTDVVLNYEDVDLEALDVELDFGKNELSAAGRTDSNGQLYGTPVFKQGELTFRSEHIHYNFESKNGLIRNVITQQDESFLHGEIVKKDADNNSFIYKGKYTTCNLPHPHFEAFFRKAKVIPNDKIITGPLGIKVGDVPLPIGLPFGYFPVSQKKANGLLLPTYNNNYELGFCFKGLGYYFSIKDYVDFALTTDIYLRGSFGIGLASNYALRYKFDGNINLQYTNTSRGERQTPEHQISHNFKIQWRHQQSAKAHPTIRFAASVSFQNESYNKNTIVENISTATQSSTTSSISFSNTWKNRYTLGINAELTQNLATKFFDLKLPYINFNICQFYPLRRKKVTGKLRWYENISMQYTFDATNNLAMNYDSNFQAFSKGTLKNLRYGMRHNIPIKSTIKLFKHISWTNTLNFTEAWQFVASNRSWHSEIDTGTLLPFGVVSMDTVHGFWASHDLTYNTELSTRLYGTYTMKKGRVVAFRHELTPSISFRYSPGLNKSLYKTYTDSLQTNPVLREVRYSPVASSVYGVPSYQTSASINFSLSNRLEMKVKNKKEEGFKKITLLDNVSLSTGYDFAADSLRWKKLNLSGRTTLFKSFNISFNFDFDPYSIDTSGHRCNILEIKANKRLFRMSSTSFNFGFSYTIDNNTFNKNKKAKKESPSQFGQWNISLSYNLAYNLTDNYSYYAYYFVDTLKKYDYTLRNIVNISGRFALTPKWNLTISTGYDFTEKNLTASEFGIERDLHCWRMGVKWIPFGYYRNIEFSISAKANMLRDVKWDQKKQLNY